ncbi:MAG TPA: DUF5615 family PIN-like protein [Pirellulales bacterium]|nr:DUF5615 family PIN-like protein [Pirellulales bacterium]HVC96636.1 DUF5615 family PIN-like protein [Pirellulales bacterium]
MTGILADANIEGHLDFLFDLLTSKAWIEFWQALGIRYATFKEIGLAADDTDDVVWQCCQNNGYVLITSNRNQKGAASLEATIRERATSDSLPVLTLADAERFRNDREYAERVVASLLEILLDMDCYRGAGRLYLP